MITDPRRPIFTAFNAHTANCGTPPAFRDDRETTSYYGYFANRYGEQWLISVDPETKTGILRGGDIGWDNEVQINDGVISGDVILGDEEVRWLDACWRAATGEPLE